MIPEQNESWFVRNKLRIIIASAILIPVIGLVIFLAVYFSLPEQFPPKNLKSIDAQSKLLQENARENGSQLHELAFEGDSMCYKMKMLPAKTDLNSMSFANDGVEVIKLDNALLGSLSPAREVANNDQATRRADPYAFAWKMFNSAQSAMKPLEQMIKKKVGASEVYCIQGGTNMRNSLHKFALRIFHIDLHDVRKAHQFNIFTNGALHPEKPKDLPFEPTQMINVWMNTKDEYMKNYHLGFLQNKFLQKTVPWNLDVQIESLNESGLRNDAYVSIPNLETMKWGDAIIFRTAGPNAPPHAALHTIYNFGNRNEEWKNYERVSMEFRCIAK